MKAQALIGHTGLAMLRRLYRRKCAPGMQLRRIDLEVLSVAGGANLVATYHLEKPAMANGALLAFDLWEVGPCLKNVASEEFELGSAIPVTVDAARKEVPFLLFRPKGPSAWTRASITFKLSWLQDADRPIRFMVAPDLLPVPLLRQPPPGSQQPIVELLRVDADFTALGLDVACGSPPSQYCSVVIGAASSIKALGRSGSHHLALSETLWRLLSEGERLRTQRYVTEIMEFFSDRLGIEPSTGILLKTYEETVSHGAAVRSPCISVTREDLGLGESAGSPSDVFVAEQIAGLWWGLGCRLLGSNAGEWENGLTLALALKWLEQVSSDTEIDAALDYCRTAPKLGWLPAVRKKLLGQPDEKRAVRLAAKLYDAMSQRASGSLRELTRESWGRHIPVQAITSILTELRFGRNSSNMGS